MADTIRTLLKMLEDESEPSLFYDNSSTSESDSVLSVEEFQMRPYQRKISFSSRTRSSPYCKTKTCKNKQNQNSASKKCPLNVEVLSENVLKDVEDNKDFVPNETYREALAEIENLQSEISKLKSTKSSTPWMVRRKSLQSSMIKTCLFRNSSTVLKPNNYQNSTRSSLFGGDSTCNTIDIDDAFNMPSTSRGASGNYLDFLIADPFLVKPHSPELNKLPSHDNTDTPLLSFQKNDKKNSKVYQFLHKFVSCPNIKSFKMKGENKAYFVNRNNKISPIPRLTLITPSTTKSNGNFFYRKR